MGTTELTGSVNARYDLTTPAWVRKGFRVEINGRPQRVDATPGSYLRLSRTWRRGDQIKVSMPFSIRIERAIDRPDTQSVFWGPLLLPILGDPGQGGYRELTLYRYLKLDGDYSRAAITPVGVNTFTTHGFTLRPQYVGDTSPQSPYFRRVEPEVVFGSLATGVPNYKRDDDLPNYDVPVTGIVSPGDDGLTFLDALWDHAPFDNHGQFVSRVRQLAAERQFTPEERDTVTRAAAGAWKELRPKTFQHDAWSRCRRRPRRAAPVP